MINFNLTTINAEISKIANSKITDVRDAEKLGMLFSAHNCLTEFLEKKNNYVIERKQSDKNADYVTNELNDILPALKEYQNAKADFQQHKITQDCVNHHLQRLVVEINEFLVLLYSNTASPDEREILNGIKAQ